MADLREPVLVRLLAILDTVPGVVAGRRNENDVPGLARPAIILRDGAEEPIATDDERPVRPMQIRPQRMRMTPSVVILVGADPSGIGALVNPLRDRLRLAVLGDAELWAIVGSNGEVRYKGCELIEPGPESRDWRMECSFGITYVL